MGNFGNNSDISSSVKDSVKVHNGHPAVSSCCIVKVDEVKAAVCPDLKVEGCEILGKRNVK